MTSALTPKAAKTVASRAAARLDGSVGALIDALYSNREERRGLEASIKDLNQAAEELEKTLLAQLEKQGLDKASGATATASITHSTTASLEDEEGWQTLYKYIKKTGYFHLLQRRISDVAYRELLEAGKKVPGLKPVVRKRLNLRTRAGE